MLYVNKKVAVLPFEKVKQMCIPINNFQLGCISPTKTKAISPKPHQIIPTESIHHL